MKIKEAQTDNLTRWAELRHALWPDTKIATLQEEAHEVMASPDEACFLLMDDKGNPQGFAEVALHSGEQGPYGHLEGWYVVPEYRGKSWGGELVGAVEQWCLHRAIRILTSDTDPPYTLSPEAHKRAGFKKIHEFTIFMKDLKNPYGEKQ